MPSWSDLLLGLVHTGLGIRPDRRLDLARTLEAIEQGRYLAAASVLRDVLDTELAPEICRQLGLRRKLKPQKEAISKIIGGIAHDEPLLDEPTTPVVLRAYPTSSHRLLVQLGFRALITTNYDDLLERAWPRGRQLRAYSWSHSNGGDLLAGDASIIKLHGDTAHLNDIILAREDYRGPQFSSRAREACRVLLAANQPLWLGYGHDDPDLDLLLDEGRSTIGITGGFAIHASRDPALQRRLRQAQISAIPLDSYDDVTPYLQALAVRRGTPVSFAATLASPLAAAGPALVASFVQDFGLDLEQWQIEPGSDRLSLELPALQYKRMKQLLAERNTDLWQVLVLHHVVAFDGVTIAPVRTSESLIVNAAAQPSGEAPARDELVKMDSFVSSLRGESASRARPGVQTSPSTPDGAVERDPIRFSIFSRLLDRSKAWGLLLERCRKERGPLAVLVHGSNSQDLPLFLERIYCHFNDDAEGIPHKVHDIALEEDGGRPQTAAEWEARLRQSAGYHGKLTMAYVLGRSLVNDPVMFLIHGTDYGPFQTLEGQELSALVQFISVNLPSVLEQLTSRSKRRFRLVIPIEHTTFDCSLDPTWSALDGALKVADERGLKYLPLPELTLPTWREVRESIVEFLEDREIRDYPAELLDRCEQVCREQKMHPSFSGLADAVYHMIDPLVRAKARTPHRR
nr:SIR2 family protein [Nannocystis sp. ILAH1]